MIFCIWYLIFGISYGSMVFFDSNFGDLTVTANTEGTRMIEVSQRTYERLLEKVVAFEETPDSVIVRLLDEVDALDDPTWTPAPPHAPPPLAEAEVDIAVADPFDPPNLKFTKVINAEVDGRSLRRPNWTAVRQEMVTLALERWHNDVRRLLQVCPMNATETRKDDEGYAYYEKLGLSIQGQDANHAWRATAPLARELGVRVRVRFQWRPRQGAKYPGKTGLLTVT